MLDDGSGGGVGCGKCRRLVERGRDAKNHFATKTDADTERLLEHQRITPSLSLHRFVVLWSRGGFIRHLLLEPAWLTKAHPAGAFAVTLRLALL